MKILVTGANGFIGKTLTLRAKEQGHDVVPFTREHRILDLPHLLAGVDAVIHLAGINRPQTEDEFATGNKGLTESLCNAIAEQTNRANSISGFNSAMPIVVLASSAQAAQDNAYGRSKLAAEQAVLDLGQTYGVRTHIYRLPNVFGKWCKPNYNSVVATFCHNIAQNLPIQINDESKVLTLVYVDDVVNRFLELISTARVTLKQDLACLQTIQPEYSTTLGQLARQIEAFKASRVTGITEAVGTGFDRALYSTYISYLKPEQFSYPLTKHKDPRGEFVEMLKTKDAGQFSYFTAHPGITRGGHYHHTKTEKFLVIRGTALFKFRHIVTNERFEQTTSGAAPTVVETIPGWTHDITNIGTTEMVVMLWANEIFDRQKPDTINSPL
jgi:UDP-2-acetamido-2,6-beta-L-arabino-hexul-4-ose reductase